MNMAQKTTAPIKTMPGKSVKRPNQKEIEFNELKRKLILRVVLASVLVLFLLGAIFVYESLRAPQKVEEITEEKESNLEKEDAIKTPPKITENSEKLPTVDVAAPVITLVDDFPASPNASAVALSSATNAANSANSASATATATSALPALAAQTKPEILKPEVTKPVALNIVPQGNLANTPAQTAKLEKPEKPAAPQIAARPSLAATNAQANANAASVEAIQPIKPIGAAPEMAKPTNPTQTNNSNPLRNTNSSANTGATNAAQRGQTRIEQMIEKSPLANITRPQTAPSLPSNARAPTAYNVQAGVFTDAKRAEELQAKLIMAGVPASLETRVQIGPFKTQAEADAAREKLKKMGVESLLIPKN